MKPAWTDYRARCIEHQAGCRQCGTGIPDRRAYCSVACSDTFQENHFWNTARWEAIRLACLETTDERELRLPYAGRAICARCGEKAWPPEVNHIVPVNGISRTFGCCNHQNNLEVLCHECHLKATVEQRTAGLIGPPPKEKAPKEKVNEPLPPSLPLLELATAADAVDPHAESTGKLSTRDESA